jgi:hypothetical protein
MEIQGKPIYIEFKAEEFLYRGWAHYILIPDGDSYVHFFATYLIVLQMPYGTQHFLFGPDGRYRWRAFDQEVSEEINRGIKKSLFLLDGISARIILN